MIQIPLTPLRLGYCALIDDEDAEILAYSWHVKIRQYRGGRVQIYAFRNLPGAKRQYVLMHQHILGCKEGHEIDHRDGDGLNNQRSNLRFATRPQNQWNGQKRSDNASGFKGVAFDNERKKWKANIQFHNKRIHLMHRKFKLSFHAGQLSPKNRGVKDLLEGGRAEQGNSEVDLC